MPLRRMRQLYRGAYKVRGPDFVKGILAVTQTAAEENMRQMRINADSEYRLGMQAVIEAVRNGFFPQSKVRGCPQWSLDDIEDILNTAIIAAIDTADDLNMPLVDEYRRGMNTALKSISRGFGFEYTPD